MQKIIIGLAGEIACGKDTIADYMAKKYGSQKVSFSQPLRDVLDRLFLPQNRANMAGLGKLLIKQWGDGTLSKVIAEEILNSKKKVFILPNVRRDGDIVHLKELPGFMLIRVDAEPQTRYERLIRRGQNTDDASKTREQFEADSKLWTEVSIRKIAKKATEKIDNNGDLKDLKLQIDELAKRLKIRKIK